MNTRNIEKWWLLIAIISILLLPNISVLCNSFGRIAEYKSSTDMDGNIWNLSQGSITQKIEICDKLKSIGIFLMLEGDIPETCQFELKQGNKCKETNCQVDKDGFYYIEGLDFNNGSIEVNIKPITTESKVSVQLSNDLSVGTAYGGEDLLKEAIKLHIKTQYIMPMAKLKIFLLVISLMMGILSWHKLIKMNLKWIPFLTFCIVLCQILCKYTVTVLGNEAYYEMGGAYIQNVLRGGIDRAGIGMDDAGYWPMFARIWSFLFIRVLGLVQYAPLLLEVTSITTVAGILAFFTMRRFDCCLDIGLRFLFVLVIGCTQWLIVHSQMLLILNTAYFGVILVGFLYLLPLERENWHILPWCVLSGVMCASKGSNLVLIPVLFVILVICLIGKRWKTSLYTIFLLTMLGTQLWYVLRIGSISNNAVTNLNTYFQYFERAIWLYLVVMVKCIFRINSTVDSGVLLIVVLMLNIIALIYGIYLYKKRNPYGLVLLGFQALSFGQVLLYQLQGASHIQVFINDKIMNIADIVNAPLYSYEKNVLIIPVFLCFVCIVFLIDCNNKMAKGICIIFLIFEGVTLLPQEQYGIDALGNWTVYSKQLENDSYAIPNYNYSSNVNFVEQNATIVFIGNEERIAGRNKGAKLVDINRVLEEKYTVNDHYDLSEFEASTLLAIYINKSFISQTDKINCLFFDKYGKLLKKSQMVPAKHQKVTGAGFLPEEPIKNVASVCFCDEENQPITLRTGGYFIYEE